MSDTFSIAKRSDIMRRVKGKDTSIELSVRKKLWHEGMRGYRIHYKLPGKPDIVFTRYKLAIFIDGCFWHKCPFCYRRPESRTDYWDQKICRNVNRDFSVNRELRELGWSVIRFWEHDVTRDIDEVIRKIERCLERIKNNRSE